VIVPESASSCSDSPIERSPGCIAPMNRRRFFTEVSCVFRAVAELSPAQILDLALEQFPSTL
jgi:hypothetical protein